MTSAAVARDVFSRLETRGFGEAEAFLKRGRSRRFELGPHGRIASSSSEEGWAVRAGDGRSSVAAAGTGRLQPDLDLAKADGQPLQLPVANRVEDWQPPDDLGASLTAEPEGMGVLEGVERALIEELPGGKLLRGIVDEGSSETEIFNTRGIDTIYRSRVASLFVEAVGPWPGSRPAAIFMANRVVRQFQPKTVATRLANLLQIRHQGSRAERERGEVLLSPPVAIRLLSGILPLLIGPEANRLARSLRDRQGRIASRALTIIDNGRLAGGALNAPVDGEGVPTREVVLVDEGGMLQPLLSWRDTKKSPRLASGCMRRDSWRDEPRLAPSHLYVKPQPEVTVASLLGSVVRGHYLIEPTGAGQFDFTSDRFALPVCGFVLHHGSPAAPLSEAWLEGSISSLLHGIQAVARDLVFQPIGGMLGSPTLLVGGVGVHGNARP